MISSRLRRFSHWPPKFSTSAHDLRIGQHAPHLLPQHALVGELALAPPARTARRPACCSRGSTRAARPARTVPARGPAPDCWGPDPAPRGTGSEAKPARRRERPASRARNARLAATAYSTRLAKRSNFLARSRGGGRPAAPSGCRHWLAACLTRLVRCRLSHDVLAMGPGQLFGQNVQRADELDVLQVQIAIGLGLLVVEVVDECHGEHVLAAAHPLGMLVGAASSRGWPSRRTS